MKKFLNGLASVALLTALFTSCKKDALSVTPETKPAETAATAGRGGGIIPAPVYTLTKRGADTLTYYADGRLAKVQHSANSYTQYNYTGFGTITATEMTDGKVSEKMIYETDVNTGRVYASEEHKYSYLSPNVTLHDQTWFKFEYDAENRLVKKYNKNNPQEHTEFLWSWGGEAIANIRKFDKNGVEYWKVAFGNAFNDTKLKLLPESSGLDILLNKFGKGCGKQATYEDTYKIDGANHIKLSGRYCTFTMNSDGYPTNFNEYNTANNPYSFIGTTVFAYRVTQ